MARKIGPLTHGSLGTYHTTPPGWTTSCGMTLREFHDSGDSWVSIANVTSVTCLACLDAEKARLRGVADDLRKPLRKRSREAILQWLTE